MAIAKKTKPKVTTKQHKKRTGAHHRQSKHYAKSYWPYLPIMAIIMSGFIANMWLAAQGAVLGTRSNLTQNALIDSTNAERERADQSPLSLSTHLQEAAQAKAVDMATKDYWSHTTPDGQEPWTFITATGYQYQAAGENLAFGFESADKVANAWMKSPEHRANMLSTNYHQVGFGVAQSANFNGHGPETIVVAMYASPVNDTGVLPATVAPASTVEITRIEAMAAPALSGLVVGAVGTLAVVMVLLRHSIAWRKVLNKGERFIVKHPLLDIAFVSVAVIAVLLNQASGFIR